MYVVFGSDTCVYCKTAIMLLLKKGVAFTYHSLDEPIYKKYKKLVPKSYKYIPQIFLVSKKKKEFIGGYQELKAQFTKKATKKTLKKSKARCAPAYTKKNSESCYDKSGLIELITTYNENSPSSPIKYTETESTKSLWNKLNKAYKAQCDDEMCWANNNNMLLKKYFRPKKPKAWKNNPREWLSTTDIEDVLKQYEKSHKHFKLLGVVPMDFDSPMMGSACVDTNFCNLNIKDQLEDGKTHIGMVFNLDKHQDEGSHWVAGFLDMLLDKFYYFDSYGMPTTPEIRKLYERVRVQGEDLGKKITFHENVQRHQYKESECGVYCINFITHLLNNQTFENYNSVKRPDDSIFQFRDVYFSEND